MRPPPGGRTSHLICSPQSSSSGERTLLSGVRPPRLRAFAKARLRCSIIINLNRFAFPFPVGKPFVICAYLPRPPLPFHVDIDCPPGERKQEIPVSHSTCLRSFNHRLERESYLYSSRWPDKSVRAEIKTRNLGRDETTGELLETLSHGGDSFLSSKNRAHLARQYRHR